MATSEFKRLVAEIVKARKNDWTELTKDVIRIQAREALESWSITKEEYDSIIKMLEDVSAPPPLALPALIKTIKVIEGSQMAGESRIGSVPGSPGEL